MQLKDFMQKSNRSIFYFFFDVAWLVLAYSLMGMILTKGNIWLLLLIPLLLSFAANRWLAIGVLMHEAAHYNMHPKQRINDLFGHITANLVMNNFRIYQHAHLRHHQHLKTSQDPDELLFRIMFRKNQEFTYLFNYFWFAFKNGQEFGQATEAMKYPKDSAIKYLSQGSIIVFFLLTNWKLALCHLFVVYLAVVYNAARTLFEHWYTHADSRTYLHNSVLLNLTIYAHCIGIHQLHHTYPSIPWYNLKKAHHFLNDHKKYTDLDVLSGRIPDTVELFSRIGKQEWREGYLSRVE